jgi:hypothetical protein
MPPRHDPAIAAHRKWLDFVRPYGIVVAPSVLVDRNVALPIVGTDEHEVVKRAFAEHTLPDGRTVPVIANFPEFARDVLAWSFDPDRYAWSGGVAPEGAGPPNPHLPTLDAIDLPESGGALRPSFGVRTNPAHRTEGEVPWQLVTFGFDPAVDLDDRDYKTGQYQASPVSRAERYLRETGIVAAIVTNRRVVRLLVVPPGETSAWADFQIEHMAITAGRDIVAAMRALLSEVRFHRVPVREQLRALVAESRKSQTDVTIDLAEQVLHGLYELVRGLDVANERAGRRLLADLTTTHDGASHVGEDVYRGLLTFIMRLLFLLFAEERDLLHRAKPGQGAAADALREYYSVLALYDRLRQDQATNPDTMDHRYGAWAQLLALFRMVHNGAPEVSLVAREGSLFDPTTYPFLEGRHKAASGAPWAAPRVSDGTVFRVLSKLLVIDGARVSYRALDVEHIGAIYETMMGFHVGVASGPSVAIKAQSRLGAPTTIDLAAMLAQQPARREAWLKDATGRTSFTRSVGPAIKAAATVEELHVALLPVVNEAATPEIVPAGHLVLFPSAERRRSGSHYTPRDLTGPIVRRTLDPQLARLAAASPTGAARANDILDLKVCDPAMGSAAFLVETCRYLGDAVVQAWAAHGDREDEIPADEDEAVFARRLVAQKCIYGVDRNPMAVELAKVSLWLATLARDHPFTFIDHAFKHGDSLVGLSKRQLEGLNWDASATPLNWLLPEIGTAFERLKQARRAIQEAKEGVGHRTLARLLADADAAADDVRFFGDLVVSAFFDADKPPARRNALEARTFSLQRERGSEFRDQLQARRSGERPLVPFHWELEFPEVFDRANSGFDAFVGNPPFLGGKKISTNDGAAYRDWLEALHENATSNADLVAHFFRRAFNLLRPRGTLGLIATNTIAQGDTRASGLRWICTHDGDIYHATRRVKWEGGMAAVIVSVVHLAHGSFGGQRTLDGNAVDAISAFLVPGSMHDDPSRLAANAGKSFIGSVILGMGFTFEQDVLDDVGDGPPGTPTSIRRMQELLAEHPHYREVVMPYMGGEEVNSSPTHAHRRYIINFGSRSEAECRDRYSDLMSIVEAKVRPDRLNQGSIVNPARWWMFARSSTDLRAAIADLGRVLVISRISNAFGFTFLPARMVINEATVAFPFANTSPFASLQSRVHEVWARFFSGSLKDDLRYTPTDCFETFPFPEEWEARPDLEAAGQAYYDFRAALMVQNNEGLTKTYNRFHDPDDHDPQIARLRALHAEMDRAVLDAYGWHDVPVTCEFIEENPEDESSEAGGESAPRAKARKFRYRWPDDVRDDVMGRLIALNAARAADEAAAARGDAGAGHGPPAPRPRGRPRGPRPAPPASPAQGQLTWT